MKKLIATALILLSGCTVSVKLDPTAEQILKAHDSAIFELVKAVRVLQEKEVERQAKK